MEAATTHRLDAARQEVLAADAAVGAAMRARHVYLKDHPGIVRRFIAQRPGGSMVITQPDSELNRLDADLRAAQARFHETLREHAAAKRELQKEPLS